MRLQRYLIVAATSLASACTASNSNPYYCGDDTQCRDTSRVGYDSAKLECHPTYHSCYEGCQRDADCRDATRSWYSAERAWCDLASHDCTPQRPDGGAADAPRSDAQQREAGKPEAGGREAGADAPGDAKPADLARDTRSPDVKMWPDTKPWPDVKMWPDLKKPNGVSCGGGGECISGACTDSVCCEKASCGTCMSCKVTPGKCAPIPAGPAPAGQCPGDAACGAGTCDGKGACGYTPAKVCKASTCAGLGTGLYAQTNHSCTGSGVCLAQQVSCGGYQCNATASGCLSSCTSHAECVSLSVCDRTSAHLQPLGTGACPDPAQVAVVTSGSLSAAVAAALSGKKRYLRLTGGPYSDGVLVDDLASTQLIVVGVGKPIIKTPGAPAFRLLNGALTLQGLVVAESGTSSGAGLECKGCTLSPCVFPRLTVVESELLSSARAVVSSACDTTLHRNLIHHNYQGGISLSGGKHELVNNVIVRNGANTTSDTPAVRFQNIASGVFTNNTVADNSLKGVASIAGVECGTGPTVELKNSILWGNQGGQVSGCPTSYCDQQGWTSGGVGNFASTPGFVDTTGYGATTYSVGAVSPCVNAGNSSYVQGVTTIDLAGAQRTVTKTDVGAYEVQ